VTGGPDGAARYGHALLGAVAVVGLLVGGGLLYASSGGGSRDLLVTDLFITCVIVLGLQIFIGNTGILSLGHIGFAAIAAYTTAILATPVASKPVALQKAPLGLYDAHVGPLTASLIAIVVATAVGAIVGVAITRAPAVTATMLTVAVLFVVHDVILGWNTLTNGAGGMKDIPKFQGRAWIYVALLVAAGGARVFRETRIGRFARASATDEIATRSIGVHLGAPRMWALLASCAVVAMGATLKVQSLGSISPSQYYFDFTLLTLAMLVIGGMRSVTGAVIGVVVVFAGQRWAVNIQGDNRRLIALPDYVKAISILVVMIVWQRGIAGDWELDHVLRRLRRRHPTPVPTSGVPAHGADAETAADLDVQGVTVDFGGLHALVDVSITARSDEIVGLIGPNGAGKTTLLNVLTGVVKPSAGQYTLGALNLTGAPPHTVARAGLARTFQNLRLFGDLTVRENVAVAALAGRRWRPRAAHPDVDWLLSSAGLAEVADRRADELDYGSQRKLELARAAALGPRFLLLDEPTSGMSDQESAAMIAHVRSVAEAAGAGVLVVDHDLHFVTNICDRIYVLDQGRVIAAGPPDEIREDPAVRSAYLGAATPTPVRSE
jgi:branched-chain amino acid transport system permease protein